MDNYTKFEQVNTRKHQVKTIIATIIKQTLWPYMEVFLSLYSAVHMIQNLKSFTISNL